MLTRFRVWGEHRGASGFRRSSWDAIKSFYPQPHYFEQFDAITMPLFKQVKSNREESLNLKEIRDTLLSKLLSREIQVVQNAFSKLT